MPHLVILYTGQLDQEVNMTSLCRQLADAMLTVKDESGKQVFPTGGTRVLAYPAPHYAWLMVAPQVLPQAQQQVLPQAVKATTPLRI
jgi:5-carboxymethyl-2-hydroxymuconate isomerase